MLHAHAMPDDVVEALLDSHAEARAMVALAERLPRALADESSADVARQVSSFLRWYQDVHFADEERSLMRLLLGRNRIIDQTISELTLEHLQLSALLSRVGFLCELIGRDAARLLAVRFELADVVSEARRRLFAHQEREESMLFPAIRRLLDWDDVEELRSEMAMRRAPGVELSEV